MDKNALRRVENKRVLVDYNLQPENGKWLGFPDGMVADVTGRLWVACYGGRGIAVFDPQRPDVVAEYIRMPVVGITSLTWAGPNFNELYVTSAGSDKRLQASAANNPLAGSVFHLTDLPGNARGLPSDLMF